MVFGRKRKSIKLVISDFHLGEGQILPDGTHNIVEDFIWDEPFADFLEHYCRGEYAALDVELIINGDFFNLIQLDHDDRDAHIITEGVALRRTQKMVRGHRVVFDALSDFAHQKLKRVTFVVGNHDPAILFEGVRQYLRELIHSEIEFRTQPYRFDGVHVEHGNQLENANRMNLKDPFITSSDGQTALRLPWASRFVIGFIARIKQEYPYIDRVKPFPLMVKWLVLFNIIVAFKVIARMMGYLFRAHLFDSQGKRYSVWSTIRTVLSTPVYPSLKPAVRRIFQKNPETRYIILGHTHRPEEIDIIPGRTYINTGTWNENTDLSFLSFGSSLHMTYALIECDGAGNAIAALKEWMGVGREAAPVIASGQFQA